MSLNKVIHMVRYPEDGKTVCGVKLTGDNAVPAKLAQHATCKRCLASIDRTFR